MNEKKSDTRSIEERGWLKLDNAAKLFPAISSRELTCVFRITANLKEPVIYSALKEAVSITSRRFPYFNVTMGIGIFWHYLEFKKNGLPRIQAEEKIPLTAFALKRKDELLYRILARSNRISVEFIHVITDGGGGMEYMKSLLFTYFKLTGKDPGPADGIIIPETPVSEEEAEDGYNRFFKKLPPPEKLTQAWHLPYKLNKKPRLKVLTAEIPVNQMLDVCRSHKVTITEYFVSAFLFALQEVYLEEKKKSRGKLRSMLRIEVPVNLRKLFPSKTLRNFSLFIMPELDLRLGIYSFDEILKIVRNSIQADSDIKQISRWLSSNVGHEKQIVIRILPLFIKRLAIAAVYKGLGSKRTSGIFTNMGTVRIPAQMDQFIDSFNLVPTPPNIRVKLSCAMVSFQNRMRLNFCNITESHELERIIFKRLTGEGVEVKIINNL